MFVDRQAPYVNENAGAGDYKYSSDNILYQTKTEKKKFTSLGLFYLRKTDYDHAALNLISY